MTEKRFVRRLARAAAVPLLVLLRLAPASAATFTVDDPADLTDANLADVLCAAAGGGCTLRAAVQEANDTPGADTIVLPAGDYVLAIAGAGENTAATGDLDIAGDVAILGTKPNEVTISASYLDRVFHVLGSGTLSVTGVSIVGGVVTIGTEGGGGILNEGTLSLLRCEVRDNTVDSPGLSFGGGVSSSGILAVTDTTISGNRACPSLGCLGAGAGVYASSGTLTNVTIFENEAMSPPPYGSVGGIVGTNMQIRSSTITANSASAILGGGGIAVDETVTIRNTIIAGNTGPSPDCSGTVTSEGYNLVQDTTGCTIAGDPTGVQTGVDPLLDGPIDGEGGRMQVYLLDEGSPAIDAGNPAAPGSGGMACPAGDQLNYPRAFGGAACDLGATEVGDCLPAPIEPGFCHEPTLAGKGLLMLKDNAVDTKDILVWRWLKGESTADNELGSGINDYELCIYDDTGLVAEARVPGGGTCGAQPCWTDLANGIRFKDGTAANDGIKVLKGTAGADGKAKMIVLGKGAGLQFLPPPWSGTVVAQARGIALGCWSASYGAPLSNVGGLYKAKP